jgi:hypothetical protein
MLPRTARAMRVVLSPLSVTPLVWRRNGPAGSLANGLRSVARAVFVYSPPAEDHPAIA